jgi:hypothetical protein
MEKQQEFAAGIVKSYREQVKKLLEMNVVEEKMKKDGTIQREQNNISEIKRKIEAQIKLYQETAETMNIQLKDEPADPKANNTAQANSTAQQSSSNNASTSTKQNRHIVIDEVLTEKEKTIVITDAASWIMNLLIAQSIVNFAKTRCLKENSAIMKFITDQDMKAITYVYENSCCAPTTYTVPSFKKECYPILNKYLKGADDVIPTTIISYKQLKEKLAMLMKAHSDNTINISTKVFYQYEQEESVNLPFKQSTSNLFAKHESVLDRLCKNLSDGIDEPKVEEVALPEEIIPTPIPTKPSNNFTLTNEINAEENKLMSMEPSMIYPNKEDEFTDQHDKNALHNFASEISEDHKCECDHKEKKRFSYTHVNSNMSLNINETPRSTN